MRSPTLTGVVAGLVSVCIGATGVRALHAAPAPAPAADRAGDGGALASVRANLHVSPEQRQQVRKIVIAHRAEIAAVARPLVEAGHALRKATLAEPVDADAIQAAADALGKTLGDVAVVASRMRGELKATMTPEQIETLGTALMQMDDKVDAFLDRLETGGK